MDLSYILSPGIKWRVTSKLLPPYLHKPRFTAAVPLRRQLFPWNRRNITTESLYHYNFIQLTCGCRACRLSFDGTMLSHADMLPSSRGKWRRRARMIPARPQPRSQGESTGYDRL